MKAAMLARLKKLELTKPQSRSVITCLPLPTTSMASHCEMLADGIYHHISGYGRSIYYVDRESLDTYLKTQPDSKALVYSILSNDDVKVIIDEVEKNI